MRSLRIALPLLILLAVATSCSDDSTGPGTTTPPSLDSLWPNADGSLWSYQWMRTGLNPGTPQIYASPEEVPELPSMEAAYELLVAGPGIDASSTRRFFELKFDGMGETDSGAEGQNLEETIYVEELPQLPVKQDGQASFYAELARFRPDLTDALEELSSRKPKVEIFTRTPTLLRGGIFEKTADHIGRYGDLDENLAWIYLNSNLEVGERFEFQPVATIASDIWVYALIRRQFTAEMDGVSYPNSIECEYLIDYGISASGLEEQEFSRQFTVGTVVFAPELGPIFSNERMGIDVSLENTDGWEYNELTLLPTDIPPSDDSDPDATLENIWPNLDGDRWFYSSEVVIGPTSRLISVDDPLPGMQELYDWLHGATEVDSIAIAEEGYFGLEFDGMKTTYSGAIGQDLKESLYLPFGSDLKAVPVGPGSTLLRAILRGRPDLAERAQRLYPKIMADLETQKRMRQSDILPLFLFGYAWEKTEEHIGTYGDLDQQLAWKFLEADLDPGHSFAFQLVPSLTDDVWLHVQVWRELSYEIGGQSYAKCIEVFYVLDNGVLTQTNEQGEVIGSYRAFNAGTIIYAPELGPLHVLERGHMGREQPFAVDREAGLVEAKIQEETAP